MLLVCCMCTDLDSRKTAIHFSQSARKGVKIIPSKYKDNASGSKLDDTEYNDNDIADVGINIDSVF